MAIRTSTQSGNTHSAPFAFGSTVNDGDQLVVASSGHAITFDASCAIGVSLGSTHQGRPSVSVVSVGGALPTGTYRIRIAAVSAAGITTYSALITATVSSAGQAPRVTLPTLPAANTSWNVYLSQAGGGADSERRYATGLLPGTFDCVSSLWENGTTAYASAAILPFGDAFSYASSVTSHTGGVVILAGVTVTSKGDFSILGDLQLNAGSVLEFDAGASPSGAAIYRLFFGTVLAPGTGQLITRGTSGSRAIVQSKSGTTQAHLKPGAQAFTSGDVRLDLEWWRFNRLGDAVFEAADVKCATGFVQRMRDGIVDAASWTVLFRSAPATGGWDLERVSFQQARGQVMGGRECSLILNPTNDATTGARTVTNCAFTERPPALAGGGTVIDACYMCDGWANTSGSGGITISYDIRNCFVRKMHPGAVNSIDTLTASGPTTFNYLYNDNKTGDVQPDLNPHGLGCPAPGLGNVREHASWTIEYNDSDSSGDMFKSPTGKGTVRITRALLVPNAANLSTGTLFTFPNAPDVDYRLEVEHCTSIGGPYPLISTSEGGPQPAGTIAKFRSNLGFHIPGTGNNRFLIGKSSTDGENDTVDIAAPGDVTNNAHWNFSDVTGSFSGGYGPYNTRFSAPPGAGDVDLGDSAGSDISSFGPRFVDPSRKFLSWCEIVLGATGTVPQKIQYGLDRLMAIADTTSPNHVPGLTMITPAQWVRAGFEPQNPALFAAHDGLTIGAIEMPSPTPPTSGGGARLVGIGCGLLTA